MENWLILNKLVILIYVAINYIRGSKAAEGSMLQAVLLILIYIILNVGKTFFKKGEIRILFLALSIIELGFGYMYISPLFLLLIPMNVIEIIEDRISPILIISAIIVSVFFADAEIYNEYIAIALSCYLFYFLSFKAEAKIISLMRKCDELTERNYNLMLKIDNDEQYRNQIMYTSQIEERNKIAQEIHDKLGHSISGSVMQLEAAKLLLEKDGQKSRAIIQNTIEVLRTGMEDIRGTLKNIKPPSEQLGINKVKLLIEKFKKNNIINTTLLYNGNLDYINFEQWKVIYENISEALTNAMKYSKAKNVKVSIEVLNKLIKVEIKDDGKGCEKVLKGLGLSGMEERTANIDGKIIVDGSEGFSVIVLLPIRNKN
jgi:signal transduction histidine kinase